MNIKNNKTAALVMCSLFAALTAVGAFIRVPVPLVPFTLQFLFTTLAGLLLGSRLGAASVLSYIVMGLVGLPVFTEGGGIGYVLRPTFGYIVGFALGAYATGRIAEGSRAPSLGRLMAATFSGLLIVYAMGLSYFYVVKNFYLGDGIGVWPLFLYCFLLAVPGDVAICALSAFAARRLIPLLNGEVRG